MAAIFKRTYVAKGPDGKPIIGKDGKPEVRECKGFCIQYRDAAGKILRVTRTPSGRQITDRRVAEQLAAQLERNLSRGEVGLVDPFAEQKSRPLLDHVAEYIADLRTAGRDTMYTYNADKRLRLLAAGCGWKTLRDVTANDFIAWRERFRSEKHEGKGWNGEPVSACTLNQYLETAVAFLNWCASNQRIDGVPYRRRMVSPILATVAKVEGGQKRPRRALADEQVTALLTAAPADRASVYRVALSTGLRRGELAALEWGDVRLSAIPAYIQLRAEATKARRGDPLPLPATLAAELRKMRPGGAKDGDKVFAVVPDLKWWKRDLDAAGIPWKVQGRQVDFHGGTRKTLNTRMARAGVGLTTAQRIMRHTSPQLTAVDYIDDQLLDMSKAIEAVPELLPAPKPQAATAAG